LPPFGPGGPLLLTVTALLYALRQSMRALRENDCTAAAGSWRSAVGRGEERAVWGKVSRLRKTARLAAYGGIPGKETQKRHVTPVKSM
jgi:hypothetical protein